ncbi:MAG: hypothetical protein AB7J40_03240 [Candidatus Altimarinota bacterium]
MHKFQKINLLPHRFLYLRTSDGSEPSVLKETEGLEKPERILQGGKPTGAEGIAQELAALAKITTTVQYIRAYPDDPNPPKDSAELQRSRVKKNAELFTQLQKLGNDETLAELKLLSKSARIDFSDIKTKLLTAISDSGLSDDVKDALKEFATTAGMEDSKITKYVKTRQEFESKQFILDLKKEELARLQKEHENMQISNKWLDDQHGVWKSVLRNNFTKLIAVGGIATATYLSGGLLALAPGVTTAAFVGIGALPEIVFGTGKGINYVRNQSRKLRAFVRGGLRKATQEALASESNFDDVKGRLDTHNEKLGNEIKSFEKGRNLVNKQLEWSEFQIQTLQRDLATLVADGVLTTDQRYIDKQMELDEQLKSQQKLKEIQRYLTAHIESYKKMKDSGSANISLEDLQRFWNDSNDEGIDKAYKNFSATTDQKTKEAQKELGSLHYEDIRSDVWKLSRKQLGVATRFFNGRTPSSEPKELAGSFAGLKDAAPSLYKVMQNIAQLAGKPDYKSILYPDIRKLILDANKEISSTSGTLTSQMIAILALGAPFSTALLNAQTLRELARNVMGEVDGAEEIDLKALFPKDFRTGNELIGLVNRGLNLIEVRLIRTMVDAISGPSPSYVMQANGTVEKSEQVTERLKNEAKAVYSSLSSNIKTAFQNDFGQITSVEIRDDKGDPFDISPLPDASLVSSFDEYGELCNPAQRSLLTQFLRHLKRRGAVYGPSRVVDFADVKKFEAIDLLEKIEAFPTAKGLDGAVETILHHPERLELALDFLKKDGLIGGRSFSSEFNSIKSNHFSDPEAFLNALKRDDDRGLLVQVLKLMEDHIITIPFDFSTTGPTARSAKLAPEDYFFRSLEAVKRDIKADLQAILKFATVADITKINKLEGDSGRDLRPARGITNAGGSIQIDGKSIDDPSIRHRLPYVMLTLDVLRFNMSPAGLTGTGALGAPTPTSPPPTAPSVSPAPAGSVDIASSGTFEGILFDMDGNPVT